MNQMYFPHLMLVIGLLTAPALACGAPNQPEEIANQVAATQTAKAVQFMAATLQAGANQQPALSVEAPVTTLPPLPETALPPIATEAPTGPYLVATMDVNCRFGPDKVYDQLDYLATGEQANIEGKDKTNNWWLITTPRKSIKCWVWTEAVTVHGDTGSITVFEPPPTPTLGAPGSISGMVFIDGNSNGQFDPTDGWMTGVVFHLRKGACPGGEILETVETNNNGVYRFDNVSPGDYCVQHTPDQETLVPQQKDVTVGAGQDVGGVNFIRTV